MQPQSPNPNYDFILKNNQQAKRGLPLPNMSKPVKIAVGVIAGIILLIVISSLLSGRNKGATQPIVNVMARGQETLRVTKLVQTQLPLKDPTTQAVAATVASTLASDQQRLQTYMAANKNKVGAAALAGDQDKSTDSQLQTASQDNNLDQAYLTYLQDSLAKYESDLSTAYKSAGPKGKAILKDAYDSAKTLLSAPPLKS